jgi:uncharacterized integral membrane protein
LRLNLGSEAIGRRRRCRLFLACPDGGAGYDDMKLLVWLLRIALFIVLLGFAAKNSGVVTLRFFFDAAWPLPLVAILLFFFAAGAVAGLSAALGAYLRQRRELVRLRQELGKGAQPE